MFDIYKTQPRKRQKLAKLCKILQQEHFCNNKATNTSSLCYDLQCSLKKELLGAQMSQPSKLVQGQSWAKSNKC